MNDKPETGLLAIEIDSETAWRVLQDVYPSFRQLSLEENLGRFVIVNYDNNGPTIVTPQYVAEFFDHIAPTRFKFKFVTLVD